MAKTPYAKSTVKVASDELEKLRKPLANDAKAMRSLREVSELFDQLSDAVEQNDRAAAQQVSRRFSAIRGVSLTNAIHFVLRLLGAEKSGGSIVVPWDKLDLSDPEKPRLSCRAEDLV